MHRGYLRTWWWLQTNNIVLNSSQSSEGFQASWRWRHRWRHSGRQLLVIPEGEVGVSWDGGHRLLLALAVLVSRHGRRSGHASNTTTCQEGAPMMADLLEPEAVEDSDEQTLSAEKHDEDHLKQHGRYHLMLRQMLKLKTKRT